MSKEVVIDYYIEHKTLGQLRGAIEGLIRRYGKDSKINIKWDEKQVKLILDEARESLCRVFE